MTLESSKLVKHLFVPKLNTYGNLVYWGASESHLKKIYAIQESTRAMLKNKDDKVTLIIDGGGPSGQILCTANRDAKVKGFLTNPHSDVPLNANNEFDVGTFVGTDGFLRVIRDTRNHRKTNHHIFFLPA